MFPVFCLLLYELLLLLLSLLSLSLLIQGKGIKPVSPAHYNEE